MATIQKVSGIDFANISKFDGVDISAVGSINLIGKPITGSLLLDQSYGSGAEAAYSVRKLRTAYTGAAMQVQATSGGATAEIGFTVDNNLDTAALLAFAGTNEVGVSIWYDQSTNGNNATQVTVSNRPIVVAAGGALVEENGRVFLKSGPTLTMIFDIPTVERYDVFSMIKAESSHNSMLLGSETSTSDYFFIAQENGSSTSIKRNVTVAEYKKGGKNYIPTTRDQIYNNFSNDSGSPVSLLYFDGDFTYTSTSGFRFGYLPQYTDWGMYSQQEFLFYVESGSQVVTSIEENISDYYTENPAPYLLDTYTGAAAAYSLRKLRADYTGFAIKVQDNVGGATQDIGFNSFGELDTAGLFNYGGVNDVFVETWYDQSGNGNDATQATSANRPRIYIGSTLNAAGVVTENGKPAVQFDGTNDFLDSVGLSETTLTSFHVAKPDQTNSGDALLCFDGNTGNGFFRYNSNGTMRVNFFGGLNTSTNYTAAQNLVFALYGTSVAIGYDGATAETGSATGITTTGVRMGQKGNVDYFNGNAQEIVLYPSDQTANRTGIENGISGYYDIPLAGLLDEYTGAAAGYSLRRLSSTYTGSAIKVQDNVGGATLDVGFDSNGELNTSVIAAYGGSNDVFVETWYDQSGNGNNATQATSANRPKIYDGATGAVVTNNGKPSLNFKAGDFMADTTWNGASTTYIFNVLQSNGLESSPRIGIDVGSFVEYYGLGINGNTGASSAGIGTLSQFSNGVSITSTRASIWDAMQSQNVLTVSGDFSSWTGGFGLTRSGAVMYTFAQEFIIYNSDESANRTGIETNINNFYNIY